MRLPPTAPNGAIYEPKRPRLRIPAVAGRIVRSVRRRILHVDPARLCALPAP
ncbi:hypothetical protein GCM10009608_54050 [Pseudonocardia alaniniphila]